MLCPSIILLQGHVFVRRVIVCLTLVLGLGVPFTVRAQTTFEDGLLEVTPSPEYGFPGVSFDSTPLWSIDSPSTSNAFLRIENTVMELRDDSRTVFADVIDSNGAFVQQWETSGIRAQLTIEQVHAIGSVTLADEDDVVGLRMEMQLSNERRRPAALGVRYIIDTWFGERNRAHFRTAAVGDISASGQAGAEDGRRSIDEERESGEAGESNEAISVEHTISSQNRYVESAGPRGALRLMLSEGSGPDQVGVANIRRLNEAAWFYNTGRARGFSLRPFSVNDSALHIVFDTVTVDPDDQRSVELVFVAAGTRADIVAAMAPEPDTAPREEQDEPSSQEHEPSPEESRDDEAQEAASSRQTDTASAEDSIDSEETGVSTREEAIEELDQALRRLQEISEGEREPEPGELEEIERTIERLRDLRGTL